MAGYLDLTRLLGRVMGSDLVLSVCNTFADEDAVLWVTSRYNITVEMLKKSVKVSDSMLASFLHLTQHLGRVMGSDLVRSVTSRYNITPKMLKTSVKVTDSGQISPLWRVFWT